jgi:hypothetical protein
MIVVEDYRQHRIDVNAVAVGDRLTPSAHPAHAERGKAARRDGDVF